MQDELLPPILKYVSPDGALTLVVIREDDDVTLGFEGYYWHTHGDILAAAAGSPEEKAVKDFVDAVINSESVIEVMFLNGAPVDVSVVELPAPFDPPYRAGNEAIIFRLWDGRILAAYGLEAP